MGINQLFKIFIPLEVVNTISLFIDINLLELKKYSFTKKNLLDNKVSDKFDEIKLILKKYYIPCKYKNYLEDLNINKFITVYRQILKLHDYVLTSQDKYEKGVKYVLYSVRKKEFNLVNKNTEGIINFD
tara:strand:+ start:15 stop:401 length:387 start_codon:yes stop_codon:yes gene_type:complete